MIIPYGKQEITKEDIDRVAEVLKSDFLTQGPEISFFEKSDIVNNIIIFIHLWFYNEYNVLFHAF